MYNLASQQSRAAASIGSVHGTMVLTRRYIRPITALFAAVLAADMPAPAMGQQLYAPQAEQSRALEIAYGNSDEYAETVLETRDPPPSAAFGIGARDHERISTALSTMKNMVDTARVLVQNERTYDEGRSMLQRAGDMFREVKEHIIHQREAHDALQEEEKRDLLRKRYSDHDVQKATEDEKRALDVARRIFETMVTFPECVEKLFEECLAIINADLGRLGLSTIEVVVHEKRNINQDGYNKVVIITNELADKVRGRSGDGIVNYPFTWNDAQIGPRTLGVDGKWNCHDVAPEECCNIIQQSVPGHDTRGNNVECHIFVPFGGVGNPRRNDRVFIKLSPDGRVHEPPIIQ